MVPPEFTTHQIAQHPLEKAHWFILFENLHRIKVS